MVYVGIVQGSVRQCSDLESVDLRYHYNSYGNNRKLLTEYLLSEGCDNRARSIRDTTNLVPNGPAVRIKCCIC